MTIERERAVIAPRPALRGLRPYGVRQEAPVKLNQNESPLDWPEEVKAEVLARVAARPWHRYPSTDGVLRAALARNAGVTPEMVAVTNGSNEAILAVVETYATGRPVVLTTPGYSMSAPLALVGGAQVRPVLLRPDFSLDAPAVLREMTASRGAVIFLASPNNPTGNAFARADIEAILDAARGIVVVDEAYAHFAADSFLPDLRRYPHLVVLRTFSKAFALAGARIGWIVAREDVIASIRTALPPYNLNVFAQDAALVAMEHADLVTGRVRLIVEERERLYAAMAALDGVTPYPSQTNFLLFRTAQPAGDLADRLLRRGVLVRDVSVQPMLDRCLRVTIGSAAENDRFLNALRAALNVSSGNVS